MDEDDWLLSSMTRYDQLFMYDVAFPIRGFDWTTDHSGLWVFSTYDNERTELNLLQLPDKIINKSLTGRRDFKIQSGTLTPLNLTCIRTVSNGVVATGTTSSGHIYFWTRNERSEDLLIQQGHLSIPCESPSPLSNQLVNLDVYLLVAEKPLHYSIYSFVSEITSIETPHNNLTNELLSVQGEVGVLTLFDGTSSGQTKWQKNTHSIIHGAKFIENTATTVIVCHGDAGALNIMDYRIPSQSPTAVPSISSSSSTVGCCGFSLMKNSAITLLNNQLRLYDIRFLESPVAVVHISSDEEQLDSVNHTCVKFGIVDSSKISVSGGFGHKSCIKVYNTKCWNDVIKDPPAVFVHDGHEEGSSSSTSVSILVHDWHHLNDRMLLSAANDGSLHAWEYSES